MSDLDVVGTLQRHHATTRVIKVGANHSNQNAFFLLFAVSDKLLYIQFSEEYTVGVPRVGGARLLEMQRKSNKYNCMCLITKKKSSTSKRPNQIKNQKKPYQRVLAIHTISINYLLKKGLQLQFEPF